MAEYLITMREYNEASNNYDILYPNTVKENIKDLENLGGARIDVAIVGGAAGQVVNLSGAKTATAVTNTTGVAIFDNLQYGEYLVSTNISSLVKLLVPPPTTNLLPFIVSIFLFIIIYLKL